MKDLTLKDIFRRQQARPTRVSILTNGHWRFGEVKWPTGIRQGDGATYFYISTPFGIVLSSESNARRLYKRGDPGDYLVFNPWGYYDIMKPEEYKIRFPQAGTVPGLGVAAGGLTGGGTGSPMGGGY
jgi:hypothetical protein